MHSNRTFLGVSYKICDIFCFNSKAYCVCSPDVYWLWLQSVVTTLYILHRIFGKKKDETPTCMLNQIVLCKDCNTFNCLLLAIEISDEEAEKVFSVEDAVEFIHKALEDH